MGAKQSALKAPAETERSLLIEEVKVGCTLAMLQCLDRPHRLAYVLGEILETPGPEAAEALGISLELFRKRLLALIHTMPLSKTWNGRPDPLGGAADGIMVETSHVTIQGLKILGLPVVETPKPGLIQRLYGICRLRRDLEDLEIAQCVFLGDDLTNPLHVAIIAHGNGVNVHHSIFRGVKISVVYWSGGSRGHAMRNCFCESVYESGVWMSGIQGDFDHRNNVVPDCNYVWTNQSGASAAADAAGRGGRRAAQASPQPKEPVRYKVVSSYFAGKRRLAGSEASKLGAGLFLKPLA